jgi:two-component system, OmpR family, phosphate regulon sensor histidine kinase PhoR
MQSIRASSIIEKEIIRLNKIENYRKEFIGDISHELKTPIFAIQGFIETLLNGALHDKEVNEVFLKKAMRNVNRLIYLTKDLMEISKLETGEMKSNVQEMYLRDVILDVVESLQYKAQKEHVDIVVKEIDKNLQVRADRNQIKQVLVNLIENGIKYNREGGMVEIGINQAKNKDKIWLYIRDTGIGIDKKDLARVTERFYRVDKSRSREKGGTGLGLSIVKHIIEAHGEALKIESEPEEGSTFSFTLTKGKSRFGLRIKVIPYLVNCYWYNRVIVLKQNLVCSSSD